MKNSKKNPRLSIGKSALQIVSRLGKTASVAGKSALRVAQGEPMDAHLLKQSFEALGTTYIKLGQFIASTPSLFPKEYVNAFADCLDNTTPIAFEEILSTINNELAHIGGVGAFAHIDPIPLASASIAQVHKAVLPTGEVVAIKVQKPNVGTIIKTDLSVLHALFWTSEKIIPAMKFANLAPIIDEIKTRMAQETDFEAEHRHLNNFHQFLKSQQNPIITAPIAYGHYSTKKILTMQFLNGSSLIDDTVLNSIANPSYIMGQVLDTWFMSVLQTGEFHADLHAGNLMLLKNGQIAFLDFGLVGQIDPKSLQACATMTQSITQSDYLGVANAMIDIGMTNQRDEMVVEHLADDIKNLLTSKPSSGNPNELNALAGEFIAIGKRHGIHFPRDFALLTKQFLYFDRFMTILAPNMDMFEEERLNILKIH